MPASIGRCADLYHDVQTLRLQMEKEVEKIKARETEIQEHLIDSLSVSTAKGGDTGASGLKYRAQIVVKPKPRISDWGVLCSWVRKNDRFDMLQHRLGEKAVADWRASEGRDLPGTETIQVKSVSVTKI